LLLLGELANDELVEVMDACDEILSGRR